MKKRFVKLLALGAVGLMASGMITGPASAAENAGADLTGQGAGVTYAEANATVNGNEISFVKTLTMDTEAHVPNVSFKYTLSTPVSVTRGENGKVKDYTGSDKEYTSAKTAVKQADGTVKYTELYSGGDTTKVKGKPLFVTNTESPASSTFIKPQAPSGNGSVVGGTIGVVTFYSGGDGAHGKAGGQESKQAYQPSAYSDKTYADSDARQYGKETPTATTLKDTAASGTEMKTEGISGNSDAKKTSKDYINGAGTAEGKVNDKNSRDKVVAQGKKYARANVSLDFTDVTFNEPGVYRWVITETPSDEQYKNRGITDDNDRTRILDVYVTDDGSGKLKIAGYVMHNESEDPMVPASKGEDLTSLNNTKPDGFANDYETENLKLAKKVTGNQASRDEYFKFTLKLENMLPGTVCDVNLSPTGAGLGLMGGTAQTEKNNTVAVEISGADAVTDETGVNKKSHSNPTQLVADGNGKVEAVFWLCHNQEIQISGLSKNTKYTIDEDAVELDREGYRPEVDVAGDTAGCVKTITKKSSDNVYQAMDPGLTADTKVLFTNAKSGTIPTGLLFGVAPGAAFVLAGSAGAAALRMKKRREDEDA